MWSHSIGYLNTIYVTEANFEFRPHSRNIHSKGQILLPPKGNPLLMFGVEFLKNGSKIKKSQRWRKLYCDNLQNDTPYDPMDVLSQAVGRGANLFLRFL